MSFSGFKANDFVGGAMAVSIPFVVALTTGAAEGAQALGDAVAEQRADVAFRRLLVVEQRYIDGLADADDAESQALAACARLRMTMARSVMRARRA